MSPVARGLRCLVVAYRWFLSPILPANCRFTPSCSVYALEALRTFGAVRGGALAVRRLCRCHPWGDCGHDPVLAPPAGRGPDRRHSFSSARRS